MPAAPKPKNEAERLKSLNSYEILDTIHEKAYDDIVKLAAQVCGTLMGAVTLVDDDRQWFKASIGLDVDQTSRDISFCGHAILKNELMVVADARVDSRFADNILVKGKNGIRFYAGSPLTSSDGNRLGALCVFDRQPKRLTSAQKAFLKILANQVEILLELRRRTLEIAIQENNLLLQQLELNQKLTQKLEQSDVKTKKTG